MDITYRPIVTWPGKLRHPHERARAPFKSGYSGTLELLARELRMINAETPVVQLAIPESQFTQDGRPYARATPSHPGVIVSFRKPVRGVAGVVKIPLSFPADRFTSWESNLRAVAIALEDLRRIDRYGVTQNSEQYTGFRALPPPGPSHDAIATVEDAAAFVGTVGGPVPYRDVINNPDTYRAAYRRAAAKVHPDACGTRGEWDKLAAAKTLLDDHHKLKAQA